MTTQVPYSFQKFIDFYDFTTENGIDYRVKFADGAFLFVDFPSHLTVYEVAISPIRLGRYTTPPQDPRAEATFIKIFKDFLSEHQNSIVYVCDTNDNKQAARNRKFDMWYNKNKSEDIEKYDNTFIVGDTEIYASLIVHTLNQFKDSLKDIFLNQKEKYDK